MKRTKITAITAAIALGYSVSALSECCSSLPIGWYIEANAGRFTISKVTYPAGVNKNTSNFGWNFNAGYKFMPFLAGEVGYTRYNPTNLSNSDGSRFGKNYFYAYDAVIKGILPIGCMPFDVFAKIGAAQLRSNIKIKDSTAAASTNIGSNRSNKKVVAYYGVGAEYYFMQSFAVNAQANRSQGDSTTGVLTLYSVGVSWLFG